MPEKRLAEINDRKIEIRALLESEQEVNLEEVQKELDALEAEQTEIRSKLDLAKKINNDEVEYRKIPSPEDELKGEKKVKNTIDSQEYRNSFMEYVLTGQKDEVLKRATTNTGNIGSVIPNTIMNKIIEKLEAYGMIFNKVTKTNFKGGVTVPISNLKPTASWVAEGSVAGKQRKTTGSVVFSYHKLQMRVAVTLEAATVSLDIFEAAVVNNIYEAMIIAIEKAIIAGEGSDEGQPLGIIVDERVENDVPVSAAQLQSYAAWLDIISEIPLAYENKVELIMTDKDFKKYIAGMVDEIGQPVARVNMGLSGRMERSFLGYNVILVPAEYMENFDVADDEAVFAFFANLSDYMMNTNLQLTYKRYFDEDTDEYIDKATLIADGKLADVNSILLLKKDGSSS